MGKKQRPEEIEVGSGLVLVDKPAGWTSHDVVSRLRKLAGTRKVGHSGTLDPMATGVLVVGINRATRLLTHIVGVGKTYTATIRLGQSTSTDDAEGEILATGYANAVTQESIRSGIAELTGDIAQVPSAVSAKKIAGTRAYDLVRRGEDVALEAQQVSVSRFEILRISHIDGGAIIDVDVEVEVSSGTYVRALARDLGEALGVGGHLRALRRTAVGPYCIDQTMTMDQLAEDFGYIGLAEAASGLFPTRTLSEEEAADVGFGRRITASAEHREGAVTSERGAPRPDQLIAAYAPDGGIVGLLRDVPATPGASSSSAAAVATGWQAKPELVFAAKDGP